MGGLARNDVVYNRSDAYLIFIPPTLHVPLPFFLFTFVSMLCGYGRQAIHRSGGQGAGLSRGLTSSLKSCNV